VISIGQSGCVERIVIRRDGNRCPCAGIVHLELHVPHGNIVSRSRCQADRPRKRRICRRRCDRNCRGCRVRGRRTGRVTTDGGVVFRISGMHAAVVSGSRRQTRNCQLMACDHRRIEGSRRTVVGGNPVLDLGAGGRICLPINSHARRSRIRRHHIRYRQRCSPAARRVPLYKPCASTVEKHDTENERKQDARSGLTAGNPQSAAETLHDSPRFSK
jgi:hypothetical protein